VHKRIIIAFLASFLFFTPLSYVFADANVDPCAAGNSSSPAFCSTTGTSFGSILGSVLQFVFIVAVLLALGFLIFGGIKWITSGGDKAAVGAARGMIIAAIIGLILVVISYFVVNNLLLPFLGYPGGFGDLNARFPTLFGGGSSTSSTDGSSASEFCGNGGQRPCGMTSHLPENKFGACNTADLSAQNLGSSQNPNWECTTSSDTGPR
jgi:hypothetical protein